MITQCSAPGWVSGSIGRIEGGEYVHTADPFRIVKGARERHVPGDGAGRKFATSEEVSAFLLERGYSRPYFSPHAVGRKFHREALGRVHRDAMRGLQAAKSRSDVVAVCDVAGLNAGLILGIGAGSRWSVGVHAAARSLRPDLFPELPDYLKGEAA